MKRPSNGQHYRNLGRVDPNRNEFLIALCDRFGYALIYYRAFWSPKRGTYRCYPKCIAVPGDYELDRFELGMRDVVMKK